MEIKRKKDFIKNSEKLKDKGLDVTTLPLEPVVAPSVESAVSLGESNNRIGIPTISIEHNQKKR